MGAGGFSKERKEINNLFPLILLSLTKIKSLKDYLTSNEINGKLSEELTYIIKNNNAVRRNEDIEKMKSEILTIIENKSRNKERINLPEITINYIIEKLKQEFQGNGNSEKLIRNLFYQKKSKDPLILSLDIGKELNIDKPINDKLKLFQDDIPEIIIININNFNKSYIEFYKALPANNIPYDMIYFMRDIDEYNECFFKENGQFVKYNLNDNNKSIITEKERKNIGNPKIIFYQRKNELINSMNDNKILLKKEYEEILELMNEHIIPEHTYEDYYLMDKKIYDEIIKILNNSVKSPLKKYSEIREISKKSNLLEITLNEINKIKFPQYFIIIKKNTLEKFLKDCWFDLTNDDEKNKYKFINDLSKNLYKIKFGENHAFIKVYENKENILVCHYNDNEKKFEIESVLNYIEKNAFDSEVKNYISNRGGMEYFYAKKNLDIKILDQQLIIETGRTIGVLVNLMNLEKHMTLRKYNRIRKVPTENKNNSTIIRENKKEEVYTGHESMPVSVIIKAVKSICKIIVNKEVNNKIQESYGTGFFMNVSKTLKCLITNYHVIDPEKETEFEIEIHNHKKMGLGINGRQCRYLKKPIDITAIEIKNTDELFNDIEFLEYDVNYQNSGYEIYKNNDVFSIQHPLGNNAACASGTIINMENYEFSHNISTKGGSSGSPIILLNNNPNFIRVVGIHKSSTEWQKINYGTFIGEIIKKIKNNNNKQSQQINEEDATINNPIFQIMQQKMNNDNQSRRMSNTLDKININSNN